MNSFPVTQALSDENVRRARESDKSAEIANAVFLSRKSVDTYRSRLMKKLGVADVPGLVKFALLHGMTPPG